MTKKLSKPNVLIAVPNDALGGAEQFLKLIAKYYQKNSATVYVVFLKSKRHKGWDDVSSLPEMNLIYGQANSELKGLLKFRNSVKEISNKVSLNYIFSSHVHLTGILGILIRTKTIRTKNFIGRESTSIFKRFHGLKLFIFKLLYNWGYPELDLLICQTSFMKEQLVKALPSLTRKIKIEVISNPISLHEIYSLGNSVDSINYGDFIIAAGRLIKLKGFDILIEAFSMVKNKNLKLVILGEGPEKTSLQNLAVKLKIENRVILHGWAPNVYSYFKQAKVCVVSSLIEGFPNVLLQMMSQNSRVVSTRCAGDIENIPGVITCKTESVQELKNAIDKTLEDSSSKNREKFDIFLKQRSVDEFIKKVEAHIFR